MCNPSMIRITHKCMRCLSIFTTRQWLCQCAVNFVFQRREPRNQGTVEKNLSCNKNLYLQKTCGLFTIFYF